MIMRLRLCRPGVGLLLVCLLSPCAAAFAGNVRELQEHQVKAAFVFNLAAFVTWPREALQQPSTPLRFCLLRGEAVGRTLERLIAGESLEGRPLELVRLQPAQGWDGCHVLYVGRGTDWEPRSPAQRGGATLTVGDGDEFLRRGGMIALQRRRNRIHPVINLVEVEASALRLSSKLLRLATLIGPGQGD
jgi:hypothetical protein